MGIVGRLSRLGLIGRTVMRLGLANVANVALYRLASRAGIVAPDPAPRLSGAPALAPASAPPAWQEPGPAEAAADAVLNGRLTGLGGLDLPFEYPPNWSRNRLNGKTSSFQESWWRGSDSDPELGDIKGVWEASRFDWALTLARAAAHGHGPALDRLNALVAHWVEASPPYRTLNWRCGQEASIRVVQWLLAARVLGQDAIPVGAAAEFVAVHQDRIRPSIRYAIAQDNDHGFSESCALIIGGGWLLRHGGETHHQRARASLRLGRKWLENRVRTLVFPDGGTANYSTNYQRFILDWLSHVELWRRRLELEPFSDIFYARARSAARLLDHLTHSRTGGAPNLGANDGARAFRLDDLAFEDFRPSVQLAWAVFLEQRRYGPGGWDEPLAWLGLDAPDPPAKSSRRTTVMEDFGLALIAPAPDGPYAFLKSPRDRFRPPQADPLHLDLWTADGRNVLRDTGSYSYFHTDEAEDQCGVKGHNTVQFDAREPMRRISRFLYADWLRGDRFTQSVNRVSTAYADCRGTRHIRTVSGDGAVWTIEDAISGAASHAVLRWHLEPGPWRITGQGATNEAVSIEVEADGPIRRIELVPGEEARGYGARTPIPVLEVQVGPDATRLRTIITLSD